MNKFIKWDTVTIESYFIVTDQNKVQIDKQLLQDISYYLSPVIYEVLIRIMEGKFDMNEFEFNVNNK